MSEETTIEIIENENNLEQNSKEIIKLDEQTANTTNCLALTIQKDHKLVAIKNIAFRSIRMSWKVIISSITLGILRLFL